VFSKYYALHLPEKPPRAEPSEPPRIASVGLSDDVPELPGVRQAVQELNRRLRDVEFERGERNQLRSEIRTLDQRIQSLTTQVSTRLNEFETHVNDVREPASSMSIDVLKEQLWQEDLEPVLEKIEQFESSIEKLQRQEPSKPDVRVLDGLRRLESRVGDMEGRLTELAVHRDTGGVRQGDSVEKFEKDIADLRVSIQNATVRYSEIGELKKNDLVLLSHVESIRRDLETLKKQPSNGASAKLAEIQTDVAALHAEVRQSWKQLEALELLPAGQTVELRALKDELANFKESKIEEAQKLQLALAASSDRILRLTQQLEALSTDLKRVDQAFSTVQADIMILASRLGTTEQKVSALETTADLPRPPLEDDVHAIRDNLDEIRRFVSKLQKV
jgi:chromosome segregation ATPase